MSELDERVAAMEERINRAVENELRTRDWVKSVEAELKKLSDAVSNVRVTVAAWGAGGGFVGALLIGLIK